MAPPRTKLWNRLEREGRLLLESHARDSTWGAQNFVPDRPIKEIKEELVSAWEYLYEPTRFLERTYRYHLMMRPTRRALAIGQGVSLPTEKVPPAKPPFRRRFRDLVGFLRIVWRQGIKPSYRMQFWKQLVGILKKNPSRFVKYLTACAYGEDMFRIARGMRESLHQEADLPWMANHERQTKGA